MADVVKIFGGPGTGKTTTMVGNTGLSDFQGILHQLFEERPVEELMLIAYTRSAADEAKNRLAKLTSVNKGQLDKRITTIHSLTMGMTGIRPNNIVEIRNVPDKYNFCEMNDIDYGRNGDEDDVMDIPDDEGHIFFRILDWLRANRIPISNMAECPISHAYPNSEQEFMLTANDWENYKDSQGIYEFDDVIQKAVEDNHTVDADQLFVDECQDLYPLQQAFLENQRDVVDRIWMAGDDDQTIYEWSGADPDYFIGMETDEFEPNGMFEDKTGYWESPGTYILNQSFRMPETVLELSKKCIERVGARQEKEIKPYSEGGEIYHMQYPTATALEEHINLDDTFILCRANFQASNVGQKLIFQGIPFQDRFRTWRESTVQVRDAISALYNGYDMVDGDAAQQLITDISDSTLERSLGWGGGGTFGRHDTVDTSELADALTLRNLTSARGLRQLTESLEEQNYYQRQAIKENISMGKDHLQPDGVTVETIHWSKGKEADTVILSLNTTGAVLDNMVGGQMPDAERRLYYVGMTRTERKLVIAERLDEESNTFTARDLFGEDWQDEVELQ